MKDFIYAIAAMLLIAACFYAFQLVVLLIVGYVIYLVMPVLKIGNNHIRKRKW